jgi:signal transduction histidine kinase
MVNITDWKLEANGRVEHAPDGTPLSFPGVLIDIGERRRLADERDRAAAALRDLNDTLEQRVTERTIELMRAEEALRQSQKVEAIGLLTGGVAHDFNNLLTVIKGSVELLRRPDVTDERQKRYTDAIADTADRAAKLTGQLLAFARRQALKPETFDAGESVVAMKSMVETLAGSNIRVVIDIAPAAHPISADRSQFDTAIINMAVNARDAMKGKGMLTMSIATVSGIPATRSHPAVEGNFVTITVRDTGSGIAPDQIDRIFEPFFTTKMWVKAQDWVLVRCSGLPNSPGVKSLYKAKLARVLLSLSTFHWGSTTRRSHPLNCCTKTTAWVPALASLLLRTMSRSDALRRMH